MLFHKACHSWGLDNLIYRSCNHNTEKDYYFYIWDYCTKTQMISNDFFHEKCNIHNTWNYGLNFEDTSKKSIVTHSPKYGFGDYSISDYNEERYIVKAISHLYTTEKYGQCQLINKCDIGNVDKTKYIIQPVLKNNKGEELNIFIFKNMNTNAIHLISVMVTHDVNKNVNRKYNQCSNTFCDLTNVFGEKNINNLKQYCKAIHLDYGRVELINDVNRGWCVIDINNSPGGGPLTNMIQNKFVNLFNTLV